MLTEPPVALELFPADSVRLPVHNSAASQSNVDCISCGVWSSIIQCAQLHLIFGIDQLCPGASKRVRVHAYGKILVS